VRGDAFKAEIEKGASDEQMAQWMDNNGTPKTPAEVTEWSEGVEAAHPYQNPEKREWFIEQVTPLGLDPQTSSLFDFLEADDKALAPV